MSLQESWPAAFLSHRVCTISLLEQTMVSVNFIFRSCMVTKLILRIQLKVLHFLCFPMSDSWRKLTMVKQFSGTVKIVVCNITPEDCSCYSGDALLKLRASLGWPIVTMVPLLTWQSMLSGIMARWTSVQICSDYPLDLKVYITMSHLSDYRFIVGNSVTLPDKLLVTH